MSRICIQDRVRELMATRDINANQIAKNGGLDPSTVYTFLRRDRRGRNVHHVTLTKIAAGLGVPIGLLLDSDPGTVQLLTVWSTLDSDGQQTVLALAAALSASQG